VSDPKQSLELLLTAFLFRFQDDFETESIYQEDEDQKRADLFSWWQSNLPRLRDELCACATGGGPYHLRHEVAP
jgi:hypothetical protein